MTTAVYVRLPENIKISCYREQFQSVKPRGSRNPFGNSCL